MPVICILVTMLLIVGYLWIELRSRRYLLPVVIGIGFFLLFFEPLTDWDARSIWFFHAKRMFFDGSIDASLDGYGIHIAYPDLIPAAAASITRLFGIWNEFLPKIVLVMTLVPPFLILLSRCQDASLRLLMLCLLIFLSRKGLLSGSMDAHLALYAVSAIVLIREEFSRQVAEGIGNNLTPIMVLLCCMASIKNEGMAMVLLLLPPMAILLLQKHVGMTRIIILAVISMAAAAPLVIWKLKLSSAGISTDLFIGDQLARLVSRLSNGEWRMVLGSMFNRTIYSLLAFLVLALVTRKLERLVMYFVGGYLMILFCIYLSTPADLAWHLATSMRRVVSVVGLLVVALFVLELQAAFSRKASVASRIK